MCNTPSRSSATTSSSPVMVLEPSTASTLARCNTITVLSACVLLPLLTPLLCRSFLRPDSNLLFYQPRGAYRLMQGPRITHARVSSPIMPSHVISADFFVEGLEISAIGRRRFLPFSVISLPPFGLQCCWSRRFWRTPILLADSKAGLHQYMARRNRLRPHVRLTHTARRTSLCESVQRRRCMSNSIHENVSLFLR